LAREVGIKNKVIVTIARSDTANVKRGRSGKLIESLDIVGKRALKSEATRTFLLP